MNAKMRLPYLLGNIIFASRWLQTPLYLGLILILAAYVYRFLLDLCHLFFHLNVSSDTALMLNILDLIDVVMIANLLIMVVLGGYKTFISTYGVDGHPDLPEWLYYLDASTMKTKLALTLVGISSIHLLRTFIDPTQYSRNTILAQIGIHITLLLSVLTIALTNRWMKPASPEGAGLLNIPKGIS